MPDLLAKLLHPAALFAGVLGFLAWRALRAGRRGRFAALLAALAAYLFLATPLGATPVVLAMERSGASEPVCRDIPPDALVIVLAGGIAGGATSTDDATALSAPSLRRVLAAARIGRQVPSALFILSGGGGEAVREADLMRRLMIDLGVAADRLVPERESRNTWENATASARIVDAKGWRGRPRVLVTSAIHMPRSAATFRKAGLDACTFAAERRWDSIDPATAWIPESFTLLQSLSTMREVAALAWYAASGRL